MNSLAPLPELQYTEYITRLKNSVGISNELDIFSTRITTLLVGMKIGLLHDTERTRYLAMYLSSKASQVTWAANKGSQLSQGMIPESLVTSDGGTGGRCKTGMRSGCMWLYWRARRKRIMGRRMIRFWGCWRGRRGSLRRGRLLWVGRDGTGIIMCSMGRHWRK
jgi:hypothetical protein